MNVYLTNLSDQKYERGRVRLNESARKFGILNIRSYCFEDLKSTDFYTANRSILEVKKGTGAWLWKPYIIMEALKAAAEGDVIFYSDCGIEIISSLDPLVEICATQQPIVVFANGNLTNAEWTKRDCFILMNTDTVKYWYGLQSDAAFGVFRKCEETVRFIGHWLQCCTDRRILIDEPNICGKKNLPGFIEHRWDQSVLSLLAIRFNIPLYRMPSQFGNHYKAPAFRESQEFNCVNQYNTRQVAFYSKEPYMNSPYFQLLNHHRDKLGGELRREAKLSLVDIAKRFSKKRCRAVAGKISRWYNTKIKKL